MRDRYFEIEHIIAKNFTRYDNLAKKQLLKYQGMAKDVDKFILTIKTVSDVATYEALITQIASNCYDSGSGIDREGRYICRLRHCGYVIQLLPPMVLGKRRRESEQIYV